MEKNKMITMTEPKVEERAEQTYVGIRSQVPMSEFGNVIPQSLDEIFGWLKEQGIEPAGAPLMRYYVINMDSNMDIELGVPVATPVSGNGRIQATSLPAGRYAALTYTGDSNGIAGNKALLEWVQEKGLTLDTYDSPDGDGFGGRVEFFLTDPDEEPNMDNWQTEVAMRLADEPSA
jgi:effector-binding domain-containing protein